MIDIIAVIDIGLTAHAHNCDGHWTGKVSTFSFIDVWYYYCFKEHCSVRSTRKTFLLNQQPVCKIK